MEEGEEAGGVQITMSADSHPNPQKIFFAPRTENHADSKPPERALLRSIPRPTITIPTPRSSSTNRSQVLDYVMRSREGTPPPLSSSDVLMSSFNVLEDGDPVHHYQVHGQGTSPSEHDHHPHEYPTSSTSSVSWSGGGLEHNSNSILRALREPQGHADIRTQFLKTLSSSQAVYTTSIGQRPLPSSRIGAQWSQFEEENQQPSYQYTHSPPTPTAQDLSSTSYIQQRKTASSSVKQSLPDSTSQGTLTRAVKETFSIAHFSCTHCSEKFRIPEKLAEHVKTVHSGSIVYTCFTCGQKFFNSYDLREHVASHANDPIKCSLCAITLSSSKELRNHHKKMHPMSSISCPLCEKIFASTSARAKHLAVDHQNDGRLTVCDLCGDAFLDKALYEEHCKTHQSTGGITQTSHGMQESNVTEIPMAVIIWKCDKCGTIFPNDRELASHKETTHRDDIYPKTAVTQTVRNSVQEKAQLLKHATPDFGSSRYELLRLLLAKRMASSSKAAASSANIPNLPAVGLELNSDIHPSMEDQQIDNSGEIQQHGNEPQQVTPGFGPGILSAEAMQHVADELSILEQTMDKKKRQVGTFLTKRSLPVTADMMMDGESTIGINLAIKKNTSQDMNLQEIHKQKTLVNRLQGTVASIIEKEVKCTKPTDKIAWNMDSVQLENVNHNVNNGHYIAEYECKNLYIKPNDKPLENNNMIYENRNFCTSFATESHQVDATYVTAANVLPQSSDRITPQADSYPGTSLTSASPHIDDGQGQYEAAPHDGFSNKYSKATSPWDDHIEPLLKLFQNVGSSPIEKEQKTNDANSRYLLPHFSENSLKRESILDLSGNHQNVYTSSRDNGLQHVNTLHSSQILEPSKSGKLPSFMTLTSAKHGLQDTLGYGQETTSLPVQTNTRLPHFSDIAWSKLRSQIDGRDSLKSQMQIPISNSDYIDFRPPHSSRNQMSGGQFHYAPVKKQEDDTYYGQNTDVNPSHEKTGSSSIHVQSDALHQQLHHEQQRQPQNYEYKGIQQHQQLFQPQQDHLHLTRQSEQEHQHQQMKTYKSFISEGPSHYEGGELHSPMQQHTSFTPSPTQDEVTKSRYTDLTPVQLPIHTSQLSPISPPVQDMQHQNYTALLRQNSYSPDQQQIHQQQYNLHSPISEYEQTNTERTVDRVYRKPGPRCVSQNVNEAITQYLNGRNACNLSKKAIPEVPLVIRHKLLASILTDEDENEVESDQNQMSPNVIQLQPELPNTDVPLLALQSDRQCHPMSSPLLYNHDNHAIDASRSSHLLNRAYSQPGCSTTPITSNYVNRTLSQQDISMVASPGPIRNRTLSQPNTNTIDNEVLNQIMPSQLPVPLPRLTSPLRQHKSTRSWPTPVQPGLTTAHLGGRAKLQNHPRKLPPPYQTKVPGANKRKRQLMGPACQRRQVVIIIQKADDEYYMGMDTHVNLTLPKRSRTCVELGCLIAVKSDTLPQQRMRGRPPKTGNLVTRKGSYKKGRYPCPVCGNFYAWKNYLRIHIAKHAKKALTEGNNKLDDESDLKGE